MQAVGLFSVLGASENTVPTCAMIENLFSSALREENAAVPPDQFC